jgi:hypothetical protein
LGNLNQNKGKFKPLLVPTWESLNQKYFKIIKEFFEKSNNKKLLPEN